MFSRQLRSALFIDFENLGSGNIAANIGNLLQWFSDGAFEPAGRKRRLLTSRVYWNSAAERHRDAFTRQNVEVVLCERFTNLKNSADIKMAIDIIEFAMQNARLDEIILLTTDSDFVPVVQWLSGRGVKTAIVVNEDNPTAYTAFSYHADLLIPRRHVADALRYVPPAKRGFFWRTKRPPKTETKVEAKLSPIQPQPSPPPSQLSAAALPAPAQPPPAKPPPVKPAPQPIIRADVPDDMRQSLAYVLQVVSDKPNQYTSQRDIETALAQVPAFSKLGADSYLGHNSYRGLMQALSKLEPRIQIGNSHKTGVTVRYVPDD